MTRLLLLQGLLFASRGAAAKFTCADTHEACKVWAKAGECTGNPEYMQVECAVSCGTCERQRARGGAHHDCNEIGDDAHVEGDISQTMARLLATPELRPRVLSRDPWVLQMDTFISEEFAMEVRRVGGHHFEQSLAGYGNGIVSSRTSSTSWCNVPKCEDDEVMVRLKNKIVALLGPEGAPLPLVNTEHLQVLEYEEGEFYKVHHDQNSPHDAPYGPRVWTFFTYLSNVSEGGGTRFPRLGWRLNITVTPRMGRAILWPSVRDDDLYKDDHRTEHEALPVTRGIKYAANFWTHLRDFQTPHKFNCKAPQPAATARREEHQAQARAGQIGARAKETRAEAEQLADAHDEAGLHMEL